LFVQFNFYYVIHILDDLHLLLYQFIDQSVLTFKFNSER